MTHPPIRSYVLRQGRFSPGQQRAYAEQLPRFGVPYAPAPLDLDALFGAKVPVIVEIGSGMGETTAQIAQAMPHNNFVAVEVHTPGVGALLKLIEQKQLTNLRVIQHDAVEVVQQMIAERSLAGVHLFFPDPWPKARHHKRRIVQPPFIKLLASRVVPGGYLHFATDWEPYAQWILEVLSSEPSLINANASPSPSADSTHHHTAPGFAPRPAYRPITKFESRGLKLGHGVWDLLFHTAP